MAQGANVRGGGKQSFWRRHIQAQRKSGESIRAYCQKRGLKESTFYWWRAALARREAPESKPGFVPVRVVSDPRRTPADVDSSMAPVATDSPASIEIVLPGGRQVRICGPVDKQQLADVLSVLEAASC